MFEEMLKIAEEKMRLYTQNGIARIFEYADRFLYYEDTIPIGYSSPCVLCIKKDEPTKTFLFDDYEFMANNKPIIHNLTQ